MSLQEPGGRLLHGAPVQALLQVGPCILQQLLRPLAKTLLHLGECHRSLVYHMRQHHVTPEQPLAE